MSFFEKSTQPTKKPITNPFKIEAPENIEPYITFLRDWARVSTRDSGWIETNIEEEVRREREYGFLAFQKEYNSVYPAMWKDIWQKITESIGGEAAIMKSAITFKNSKNLEESLKNFMAARIGAQFDIWESEYPYRFAVQLGNAGIVATCDGEKWRLHGRRGDKIQVLAEFEVEQLLQ